MLNREIVEVTKWEENSRSKPQRYYIDKRGRDSSE